jgi:hypothetical protein
MIFHVIRSETASLGETMASQPFGTEYGREWKRLRELQQTALRHLMETGPTKWDALYDHIDRDKSGEVAHALRYLARWMHITIDADSTVRITASGARQLQRRSA